MEIVTAKEFQMLEIQTTVHHGHVMHFVLLTASWEQANLAAIIRRLEDGLCLLHWLTPQLSRGERFQRVLRVLFIFLLFGCFISLWED